MLEVGTRDLIETFIREYTLNIPSSQTHVSKPYRRFIHKEFGHVSSKPCLLREYVQACQVPGWLTRTLQEDSLNRQRVFNRIKLQSYAVSFGCILMSQLPFVRTWRCVQRISISFLFSWFPRLIVVPLSSHEVDGVRKEKERLTADTCANCRDEC